MAKKIDPNNIDPEFFDQSQPFPLALLMTFLVVFATIFIIWWTKFRSTYGKRLGECLLLCGISNSGKTVLYSRLVMNFTQQTVTSMTINRGSMTLHNTMTPSSSTTSKRVHVMDIPGNYRIRKRDFDSVKLLGKAIIFVIDSTKIQDECKDVADYLYEILTEKHFRQQRIPLLIFCNKQDKSVSSTTKNCQAIKDLLETELTMMRKSRASSVGVHQEQTSTNSNDDIGRSGKEKFEFADVKDLHIEFVDGSTLGTEKNKFNTENDDAEEIEQEQDDDKSTGGEETAFSGDETDVGGENEPNLDKVYAWLQKNLVQINFQKKWAIDFPQQYNVFLFFIK